MDHLWNKHFRNSKGWKEDNLAMAHPRIILGPAHAVTPSVIRDNNISHIVNCADNVIGSEWFKAEYPTRYDYIGAIDGYDQDITKWYPKFEETMNRFLADPDCSRIYVHCECGINRSAFLTMIYMCIKFGYPISMVITSMTQQRPCVLRNPTFREQAIEYIKKHQVI
jgi:hypothetical protein